MNDTLRFGVLSTADIGIAKVIPAIQQSSRCEVIAISSRDHERARAAAGDLGIPKAHGSYEALLDDPEVDAVYIPLPNHLHAEWTMAAAAAGKHVLCEKPLALDAAQAAEMVEACAEAGVVFMEAFMYRLHPSWVAVRDLVSSGRIGDLVAVQSWFSYFNDDATNIRSIPEYGGGALMDIGSYSVSLSRLLFDSEPETVRSVIRRDPVMGIDTLTSAILGFDRGVATFTCSIRTESDQRVHVVGTEGRISVGIPFNIPGDRPTRIFVTAGGDPPVAPDTEVMEFASANPYTVEAERFAETVLDGAPLPITGADSIANMKVIDRIFAAGL